MRLLFGHDEAVAGFVGQGLGIVIHPPFTAIGIVSDDGLSGGMVFNNFNGSNIDLTVYTVRPATRGVIRAAAHYVFIQLGCNRISATTRRSNKRACKAIVKLGFTYEATRKQWFGPNRADDGIAYVMTREQAGKWL
jgi:hypothetical protein